MDQYCSRFLNFFQLFLALQIFLPLMTMSISPNDFFPSINGNLSRVQWAHAVNNVSYLNQTLSNNHINMIEADVSLGPTNKPIIAHSSNDTFDLTLETFLTIITIFNDEVIGNGTKNMTVKGIKLDFKSTEVINYSVSVLQLFENITYPLWLNAFILPGPINLLNPPVDATQFLQNTTSFINTTLSLGWTTDYGPNVTAKYNATHIDQMLDTITENNIKQNLTFPIRAGIAAGSDKEIINKLLTNTTAQNSTLTIWSHQNDSIDYEGLRNLISFIGLKRIYIDVPKDVLDRLHLDNLATSSTMRIVRSGSIISLISAIFIWVTFH